MPLFLLSKNCAFLSFSNFKVYLSAGKIEPCLFVGLFLTTSFICFCVWPSVPLRLPPHPLLAHRTLRHRCLEGRNWAGWRWRNRRRRRTDTRRSVVCPDFGPSSSTSPGRSARDSSSATASGIPSLTVQSPHDFAFLEKELKKCDVHLQ